MPTVSSFLSPVLSDASSFLDVQAANVPITSIKLSANAIIFFILITNLSNFKTVCYELIVKSGLLSARMRQSFERIYIIKTSRKTKNPVPSVMLGQD